MLFFLLSSVSVWGGDFEATKKLAEQGNIEAQYDLGSSYYFGVRAPLNRKQAVFWFTKAAEKGHADAQNKIGLMYKDGDAVRKDYTKAVYWFTKAANQGDAYGQYNLAHMYYHGFGVSQDYGQALRWYTKAAKQGYADAQASLGLMYTGGQGVPKDYKKATYWLTKAADQGNFMAQLQLQKMCYEGQGEPQQDYDQSVSFFTKLAEQGDIMAQFNLGAIYERGCGVPQDYKKALYWWGKAARQGEATAQFNLGVVYSKGQGVLQDYKKATYWFTKAANQGDAAAQYSLGVMYYNGHGVPQNFQRAYVWSNLAAAQGFKDALQNRDFLAAKLSPQQLAEAQELAAKIQHKIDHPHDSQESQSAQTKIEKEFSSSGTGFIITNDGYIFTCHHVIKDTSEIQVVVGGKIYPAKIIRDDPNNDLALLKIDGSFPAIAFTDRRSAKLGQEVFTIGFPNPGIQGVSAKFTRGTISSLTGFQDDLRLYQISVPLQPGNSGGALLDSNGNIVGIVVAMLDAKTIFRISGSIPQNVNYAIKSIYALAMLDTLSGISDQLAIPSKSNSNVIDRVKRSTVLILCYSQF